MATFPGVRALAFDLFGTILDLGGSLMPFITAFLKEQGASASPDRFWDQWRGRQRIEQFQDTLLMLGHSGYLETARRALVYTMGLNRLPASPESVRSLMAAWQELSPFHDVLPALARLEGHYTLAILSNGEPPFLDHLVKNRVRRDFDAVISVSSAGAFKPHPAVYRRGAGLLGLEGGECMMVSSNAFDVVGARACGYKGAYVNRYDLPYDDSPCRPHVTVRDFTELAEALV